MSRVPAAQERNIRSAVEESKITVSERRLSSYEAGKMTIIDDICYADAKTDSIRVVEVTPVSGQMLHLVFSTGEEKMFHRNKLTGSVFSPLQDESVFCDTELFHGIVTWRNGEIDCAPEFMYANGELC